MRDCEPVLAVIPKLNGGNVCVAVADGTMTNKFMPSVFFCTDESPTWRDVCLTVSAEQWAFYGYTSEECASA